MNLRLLGRGRRARLDVAGQAALEFHDVRGDLVRPQDALDGVHAGHAIAVEEVVVGARGDEAVVTLVGGGVEVGEEDRDGALDVLVRAARVPPRRPHLLDCGRVVGVVPAVGVGRGGALLDGHRRFVERVELGGDVALHVEERLLLEVGFGDLVLHARGGREGDDGGDGEGRAGQAHDLLLIFHRLTVFVTKPGPLPSSAWQLAHDVRM